MQIDHQFFSDLARLGAGMGHIFWTLREGLVIHTRQRLGDFLTKMNGVSREDFEAVREMAINARTEQDLLRERIRLLEDTLHKNKVVPFIKSEHSS